MLLNGRMPHSEPDFAHRAELSEWIDQPREREVIRAYLRDLARVNRWFLGYRPVLAWLERMRGAAPPEPIRILDVGCGYGDGLRRIERWAREKHVAVELTGIDLSSDAIAVASQATPPESAIQWTATDVFAYRMPRPAHVIVSSLFTHHLRDGEVVRFIRWMEEWAQMGWFINDLSRAPIPYHLFAWFTKLARLHPFVQHDGPVSFLRAFVPEDWRGLCTAAGLKQDEFEIVGFKPARLCVSRRKTR
jgi:SAM-dependent methyltransferase